MTACLVFAAHVLIVLISLYSIVHHAEASSFEDTRCKCVCDVTWDSSGKKTRAVYTSSAGSDSCDCENVVTPISKSQPCTRCKCRTETRNTTVIKVVVIIIICMISLLVLYMLFLICLDPLIQRRPTSYQKHTNEEEVMSGAKVEDANSPTEGASSVTDISARQRSLLIMVQKEQKKWKGTVQEQRRNIYDKHSMLN